MESVPLPYELLNNIFKIYASLKDTLPETLLQVCSSWSAVASHEPTLWTKFVISRDMVRSTYSDGWPGDGSVEHAILTRDWAGIFKRRLARAGASLPLHISILTLHKLLLPVIDVISGEDYVHLSRWETFYLHTGRMIYGWAGIRSLISQPISQASHIARE